jgi:rod shape-determining protein MreD
MNWLKFTLWTYLVFVLHSAVAARLAVAGYPPHLVLAGLILMARRMTPRQGLLAAALWGILTDCLTNGRLGAGIVCFSLTRWVLQRCLGRRSSSLPLRLAVCSTTLIWANIVGMAVLRGLSDGQAFDLRELCVTAAGSAVYTGIIIAAAEFANRYARGDSGGDDAVAAPTVLNRWKMLTE